MASQPIPAPTPEQQKRLEKLVGLPFVVLANLPDHLIVGELLDGTKVRVEYVHELFNGALCWDAVDGSGSWRRAASGVQLQVMALAERLFGVALENALPIWLKMPKAQDWDWMNRTRVFWPKVRVN